MAESLRTGWPNWPGVRCGQAGRKAAGWPGARSMVGPAMVVVAAEAMAWLESTRGLSIQPRYVRDSAGLLVRRGLLVIAFGGHCLRARAVERTGEL